MDNWKEKNDLFIHGIMKMAFYPKTTDAVLVRNFLKPRFESMFLLDYCNRIRHLSVLFKEFKTFILNQLLFLAI